MKLPNFLLILLLALAIPVQGVAAATMLYCSSSLDGAATPGHQAHEAQAAHHHEAPGHSSLHDHHQLAAADHTQSAPALHHDDAGQAKCSVCAACCGAAALAAPLTLPSPVLLAAVPFVPESTSAASFITDGPRRPPRHLLA